MHVHTFLDLNLVQRVTGNAAECDQCGPARNVVMFPDQTPCRICGKVADAMHTTVTRNAHHEHYARYGWSGMCPGIGTLMSDGKTVLR